MGKPARLSPRSRPPRDRCRVPADPVTRALLDLYRHIEIEAVADRLLRHVVALGGGEEGRLDLRDPRHGRWRRSAEVGERRRGRAALPAAPLQRLLSRWRRSPAPEGRQVPVPAEWSRRGVRRLGLVPILRDGTPIGIAALWKMRSAAPFSKRSLRAAAELAERSIPALDNAWTVRGYRDLVIKDDQTDSYNRRHFEPVLIEETERANRYGTPLSLIFLDLDDLKRVNNRHGHLMGSQALRELCHRLIGSIRRFDKMFRFGGDEFCILLPQTGIDGAFELAERLRRAIADTPFLVAETGGVPLTASFGLAAFPQHARSGRELVQRADQAMRKVKKQRKNSIGLAPPLSEPGPVEDLREGLGR